jgi:hypothetical protein
MAYVTGADYSATPHTGEKSSVAKRVVDTLLSSFSSKEKDIDVNSLKDWDPVKLRSFGYTDLEVDYLFAKANQSK